MLVFLEIEKPTPSVCGFRLPSRGDLGECCTDWRTQPLRRIFRIVSRTWLLTFCTGSMYSGFLRWVRSRRLMSTRTSGFFWIILSITVMVKSSEKIEKINYYATTVICCILQRVYV